MLARSLLVLAVLLVLVGVLQYFFMKDLVYRDKAQTLRSIAMSVPPLHIDPFTGENDGHFGDRRMIFLSDASLAYIDDQGGFSVVTQARDGSDPPQLSLKQYQDALKAGRVEGYIITEAGGSEQMVVLHHTRDPFGVSEGLVEISTPTEPLKALLLSQLLDFLLLALVALVVGLLTYLPVMRKTLDPLSNMVKTAEQIDAGNLSRRFPTDQGQVEIDGLAESCNGMLERLEASFAAEKETHEQMRRFIGDASHELRTPLTSINGFLEVLMRGAADQPEQLHQSLKSMHSEAQRLKKLVQDLLLLTKLDRAPQAELLPGRLDELVRGMEPQLKVLAGGRRVEIDLEDGIGCHFDEDKVRQVILNLFQNAVQHTDAEHGLIRIDLHKGDDGVYLVIEDNGPGIPDEHLSHIFERFYRIDTSRARIYGGSGLGLAITQSIVELHNGKIEVVSQEGQGTSFKVWFPG
ncbi:MAG: ATP-binding protein [Deltaproteobacteria bacterium]